jgi:hypothetical protein
MTFVPEDRRSVSSNLNPLKHFKLDGAIMSNRMPNQFQLTRQTFCVFLLRKRPFCCSFTKLQVGTGDDSML